MNDGRKFLICIIASLVCIFGGVILLIETDIELWMFLLIVTAGVLIIFVPLLFIKGTEASFDGVFLKVTAPFVEQRLELSDIQGIELRREFRPGMRSYGFGGLKRGYGDFANKELGSYTYAGDSRIPAFILIRHHGNRILVFNVADEAATVSLYNSLRSGSKAEGTVGGDRGAAVRSYRKIVLIVAGIAVALVAIVIAAVFLAGHVNASLESDHLHVDAPMVNENIRYTDITVSDVELRENLDYGSRRAGYAGFDFLSGSFQNSEFGKYTLAVYSNVPKCIVVHHGGSVLVFNLGSNAETESFYVDLLSRL